jgi:hypothetical protein
MDFAPLPRRAGHLRGDRRLQTRMGIAHHQPHPAQAALLQAPQEVLPALQALAGDHIDGDHFAHAVLADRIDDDDRLAHDVVFQADLLVERVEHQKGYRLASGRSRDAGARPSSSAHRSLTCDFEIDAMPEARKSFSTLQVETPAWTASWTTAISARSLRDERASRKPGTYPPERTFGIAKSIVPRRVSKRRERVPLLR